MLKNGEGFLIGIIKNGRCSNVAGLSAALRNGTREMRGHTRWHECYNNFSEINLAIRDYGGQYKVLNGLGFYADSP